MTSNGGGHLNYDENLAESAPAATKAQIQSGYNPDLLQDKHTPSLSSRHDLTLPTVSAAPQNADQAEKQQSQSQAHARPPFFRTTRGILIILVGAAIVIGAVVGGAVGGTRKHGSAAVVVGQSSGQGAGSASGGGGQAGGAAPASAASAAAGSSVVSQSTVGSTPAPSTTGQGQAPQPSPSQGGITSVSLPLVNPGGPIFGNPNFGPTTTPAPAAPSQALDQEAGALAGVQGFGGAR